MKQYKFIAYLFLIIASLIAACEGDPGPEGPQGPQGEQGPEGPEPARVAKGSFQGTVSGIRRDGTPFTETFNYEYANTAGEGFKDDPVTGKTSFYLGRYNTANGDNGSVVFNFSVMNKDTPSESLFFTPSQSLYSTIFYFNLTKEISASELFLVTTSTSFSSSVIFQAINEADNTLYKFTTDYYGQVVGNYYYDEEEAVPYRIYFNSDGDKIYYEYESAHFNGDYYYGEFAKIEHPDGSVDTESSLYSQLIISYDGFRDATTGEELGEYVDASEDTYEVSNYSRNATTGEMSFDFSITIGVSGRYNTTKNPITITGTFNSGGRIYANITARKK